MTCRTIKRADILITEVLEVRRVLEVFEKVFGLNNR